MRSNVNTQIARLDRVIDDRLRWTGETIADGIQREILDQDLIISGAMYESIGFVLRERSVSIGSDIDDPNYPLFLNNSFVHWRSGEVVGPFRFMERGYERVEHAVRRHWKAKVRGRV